MSNPVRRRAFEVNAFTRDPAGGNPAGVVLDADGLSDEQMRRIADSLPAPDTAFVCRATGADHDMRLRFLTPRRETTFIGHATLAAQYVCAKLENKPSGRLRVLTGIGMVEVELAREADDYSVAIAQPAPELGPLFARAHLPAVLEALGLPQSSLHPEYPQQLVAQKAPRLLIGVRSPEVLDGLKPDFEALKSLSPQVGADGYFVFALGEAQGLPQTQARLFCPIMGIPEDPVSGNTHAMLGVYLLRHGLLTVRDELAHFRALQGAWVGRPGVIDVQIRCPGGAPQTVRIAGQAVITRQTEY